MSILRKWYDPDDEGSEDSGWVGGLKKRRKEKLGNFIFGRILNANLNVARWRKEAKSF